MNLLVLNLGESAKLGFSTLWSILRRSFFSLLSSSEGVDPRRCGSLSSGMLWAWRHHVLVSSWHGQDWRRNLLVLEATAALELPVACEEKSKSNELDMVDFEYLDRATWHLMRLREDFTQNPRFQSFMSREPQDMPSLILYNT